MNNSESVVLKEPALVQANCKDFVQELNHMCRFCRNSMSLFKTIITVSTDENMRQVSR